MKNISLKQAASIIGEDNIRKLIAAFPGRRLYLRNNYLDVQDRNNIIRNDFYSSDLDRQQLAMKYDLSISAIDKIIGNKSKKAQDAE